MDRIYYAHSGRDPEISDWQEVTKDKLRLAIENWA
jgi:hypothetical protein